MNEISLDELSAGRFAGLVQTKFQVTAGSGLVVGLQLIAVSGLRSGNREGEPPGGSTFEAFSLVFEGPADRPLGQGTYRFSHERLGWFELFIVPVSAGRGARQYEAVFNRRLGPGTSGSPA